MQVYLVGGAVRDQLLGLPVKERDWVVVGATPEKMRAADYQQVGKDFPVFLHPQTKEEYALARKERKVAKGYKGFTFEASQFVTLEEDLLRRDLTINAIAQDASGTLIDPYHGKKDLHKQCFRHVSAAFVEDPVRILRVARFAARFPEFTVAPETNELMQQMVHMGEVDALTPERVRKELEQGLVEQAPSRFFEVLNDCGALPVLFPHTINLDALRANAGKSSALPLRFCLAFSLFNTDVLHIFCKRYRIPRSCQDLTRLYLNYSAQFKDFPRLSAEQRLDFLLSCDALRRRERFQQFILACQLLTGSVDSEALIMLGLKAVASLCIDDLLADGMRGLGLAAEIRSRRIQLSEEL